MPYAHVYMYDYHIAVAIKPLARMCVRTHDGFDGEAAQNGAVVAAVHTKLLHLHDALLFGIVHLRFETETELETELKT